MNKARLFSLLMTLAAIASFAAKVGFTTRGSHVGF